MGNSVIGLTPFLLHEGYPVSNLGFLKTFAILFILATFYIAC